MMKVPLKIHLREVESETLTKKVTQTENNMVYYIQGDEKMEIKCNNVAQKRSIQQKRNHYF